MKIVDNSLEIAHTLFPARYQQRKGYEAFHFAFAYHGRRLLAIGQNSYTPDGRVLKFSRFAENIRKWPHPHAELDCLSRLWGRVHIDGDITLVVLRLNRKHQLMNSIPCSTCSQVLRALNVSDVLASNKYGEIVRVEL